MSRCNIYNKSFFSINHNNAIINEIFLTKLSSACSKATENKPKGLWYPIYISSEDNLAKWTDILSPASIELDYNFNPCSCQPTINNYDDAVEQPGISCDYCIKYKDQTLLNELSYAQIEKVEGGLSPSGAISPCSGILDTIANLDDILPKIPKLNQKYITKFSDFKFLNQFPSNSNAGLGTEAFIKFSQNNKYFKEDGPPLYIDWKLKETIGEIPYNPDSSQYDSMEDHTKAYNKFLQTGKTCGNFYLTQLNNDAMDNIVTSWSGSSIGIKSQSVPDIFLNLIGDLKNTTFKTSFSLNEKYSFTYSSGIISSIESDGKFVGFKDKVTGGFAGASFNVDDNLKAGQIEKAYFSWKLSHGNYNFITMNPSLSGALQGIEPPYDHDDPRWELFMEAQDRKSFWGHLALFLPIQIYSQISDESTPSTENIAISDRYEVMNWTKHGGLAIGGQNTPVYMDKDGIHINHDCTDAVISSLKEKKNFIQTIAGIYDTPSWNSASAFDEFGINIEEIELVIIAKERPIDPVFPQKFDIPYGFKNNTYFNLFSKNERIGSYWKWKYDRGILGWCRESPYRLTETDPDKDPRPIPGYDLYISPGDVFYAINDGPEPINNSKLIDENKYCPSGLKVFQSGQIAGVIPSESKFTYISENIYDKFLSLYETIHQCDIIDGTFLEPIEKFNIAAELATGPEYDKIIVDLQSRSGEYAYYADNYDIYKRIKPLNINSVTGTIFTSSNGLGFINNKTDLINTLANKYGCYLWQEPNSSGSLTTKDNINAQSAVNLIFDAVIEKDTNINTASCSTFTSCKDAANLTKKFSYDQLFSCGGATLNSNTNTIGRYDQRCNSGVGMEVYKAAITSSLLFNGNKLKETVYSSGCYVFQDIYPRAYDPKTSSKKQICGTFSNPCGPESSYGIYSKNSNSLCINGTTTNNVTTYWCDFPKANFINNSNNLNNGITNRPSGTYYNDTIYFKRAYPFAAFMPHIDTVAFHKQRGVYFQSKDFGNDTVFVQDGNQYALTSSPMTIGFTTKDVGIKIYSVSIEKLREASDTTTYNCRAFPSKDSCKCFPITFLPEYPYSCESNSSITYTNNPILYTPNLSCQYSIKSYGGYDRIYLDSIVTAGSTIPNHPSIGSLLPKVDTKINPEIPYGCEKSQTMTINNYTKSTWSFNLNKFSTTHADIWAEVIEAVNPFKTTNFVPGNEYEEDSTTTNPEYKRFATKVELNNVSLYSKQKKVIGNSRSINMTLTNPFLKGLLKGEDHILYPRSIDHLGYCKTNVSYNGDFTIGGDQMSSVGIKFSSIPRKQILNFAIQKPDGAGELKRGFFNPNLGISYNDKDSSPIAVYNSGEGYYLNYDKELFNGSYSDGIVLIGDLNIKIKKILDTIGSFDNHKKARLYLKLNDKWLEYSIHNTFGFVQDQVYIGEPYIFEHTLNDKTKFTNGPIVPVSAKQNLLFDIKYNPVGTGEANVLSSYPLMDNEKVLGGSYNLIYSNIRPYFYVGEKITENTDYLQTNFTDLLIDFDINNIGNVSGSLRPTEQTVTYYDTSDTSFSNPQTFKILSKKLNIVSDSEGYGIQTIFEIDQKPKLDNNSNTLIIDFSSTGNNTNAYGIDSVVLYQNIESLKFERDNRLANNDYKTKWGDVINYDGKTHHELSNYIFNQNYLNKYYPESLYDNFADTIAINNNTSGLHNYIINGTLISYTGLSYVLQHQRFNVGQQEITTNFNDYKNYLPFIDLNFVPNPGEASSIRNKMPDSLYNLNTSHNLYISGVYRNTPKSDLINYSDTDKKFWINLRPENLMKSALSINKEFYSNTLRIDDTPFKLRNIKTSSSTSSSSKCRAIFRPSVNISNVSFPDNFFNFIDYSNKVFKTDPFARFPIYCDTDNPGKCDGDPGPSCGIKTIGTVGVSGEYDILTESTGTITSKIGETDNIPYILSYDGGLYNIVGNNKLHYIKRFELNPINNLYPLGGCSSESSPRPTNGKFSILSEEYQKILSESVTSHTDLVKNTDLLANEMLFRILYGSKQKINLTSIDSSRDDLISYEDLIKYSDPKIEAKDIYKNIPYDLDVNSKSKNRQIIGNISIDGLLKVGKSVSISIGDSSIGINIQRNDGKIEAVATLPNGKIKKTVLHTEYDITKTLSISTSLIPNQSNDGSTITRSVGQCPTISNIAINNISGRSDVKWEYTCSNCDELDSFFNPYPFTNIIPGSPPPTQGFINSYDINETKCGQARGSSVGGNWVCADIDAVIQILGPDGFGKTPPEYTTVAVPTCNSLNQTMLRSAGTNGVGQSYATSRCGTCFTTDANYWYGNFHNKFHYGFGLGSSNAQTACECEPYEYGYCRKNSACDTCPYEYSEFTYSFEYCRHNFNLKGYKRKLSGKLQDPVLTPDPLPGYQCPSHLNAIPICDCTDSTPGCGGFRAQVNINVSYTEYCGESVNVSTTQWYVYEITTKTNRTRYSPVCAANLCNISYTNNKLTLLMGNVNECIDINLRDDCPPISITVPDNTFIVRDTIDSSCVDCDIEPNSIKMNDQNPAWEIITETRTCILGHFLDGGNPNPQPSILLNAIPATTICDGFADRVRPISNGGVCGQMGDASIAKQTIIGTNLRATCGGPNYPYFEGGFFGIPWHLHASNGAAHSAHREAWKELMRQTFEDVKPCRTSILNSYINNEPDPNPELYSSPESRTDTTTQYTINDIVEGVVPGTCSFSFATVSYPAVNIFNSSSGPQQQATSVSVLVAYYTYQYRRPKNIQDILIGEENTIKCNTISALCGETPKLSSKYKTTDCSDAPSCYNKTAKDCNNTDYCCIFNEDG